MRVREELCCHLTSERLQGGSCSSAASSAAAAGLKGFTAATADPLPAAAFLFWPGRTCADGFIEDGFIEDGFTTGFTFTLGFTAEKITRRC